MSFLGFLAFLALMSAVWWWLDHHGLNILEELKKTRMKEASYAEVLRRKNARGDYRKAVLNRIKSEVGSIDEYKAARVGEFMSIMDRAVELPPKEELFELGWPKVMGELCGYENIYDEGEPERFADVFVSALARLYSGRKAYMDEPAIFETKMTNVASYEGVNGFFHAFERNDKKDYEPERTYQELRRPFSVYAQNYYSAREAADAHFYEWGSPKFLERLAEGTGFEITKGEVPITIPVETRFTGTHIIAPSGMGKTTLLSSILAADLDRVRDHQASLILMDYKGDFIDYAKKIKRFAPGGDLAGKLVLIEPWQTLALNPLDIGNTTGHTLGLITYIFESLLNDDTTRRQGTALRKVLMACKATPDANMRTIRQILKTKKLPPECNVALMHPDDREFFDEDSLNNKVYKERCDEIIARLDTLFMEVPAIRDMMKAPHTQLRLDELMDAGKVIIIDNTDRVLGKQGSIFFTRFFVALIAAAGRARQGRENKLPCYVYMDECGNAIKNDETIADILRELRSQRVGMLLAHQGLYEIESSKVRTALLDSGVRLANNDQEADQLADALRIDKETLRDLNAGEFALFIKSEMKKAIIVKALNKPVKSWDKMQDHEFEAIREEMKARYCYAPYPEAHNVYPLAAEETVSYDTIPSERG